MSDNNYLDWLFADLDEVRNEDRNEERKCLKNT